MLSQIGMTIQIKWSDSIREIKSHSSPGKITFDSEFDYIVRFQFRDGLNLDIIKDSMLQFDSDSNPTLTWPDIRLRLEYNYNTQSVKINVFCFIIEY